jgi:hypothetical protein
MPDMTPFARICDANYDAFFGFWFSNFTKTNLATSRGNRQKGWE